MEEAQKHQAFVQSVEFQFAHFPQVFSGGAGYAVAVAINHMRRVRVQSMTGNQSRTLSLASVRWPSLPKSVAARSNYSCSCYHHANVTDNRAFRGWVFEFDVNIQISYALDISE